MVRCRVTERRSRLAGTAFVFLLAAAASAQESGHEPVIGTAGRQEITEREFTERFELTPGLYRRGERLDEEKLITAYSLVAEKLLAEEALARGLDAEEAYRSALAEVTKLLARDELYYREVRQQVSVSPEEVAEGASRARRELLIRYLFLPSEEDARFVRSLLAAPADLRTMAVDSSIDAVRDTATVVWGDADPAIEEAAYALNEGEISSVVQAGDGFYILALERERPSTFYQSLPPDVLRERVSSTIRNRKERQRTTDVARRLLAGTPGYSPPGTFERFAGSLARVFESSPEGPPHVMSAPVATGLRRELAAVLQDTLIVAGDRHWSVDQAIDELLARGFVVRENPMRRTAPRLYEAFQEWVERELLAQEAIRRGLDRSPEVRRRIAPWRDQLLAQMMKARVARGVEVTDEELVRYLSRGDARLPTVRLRELRLETLDDVNRAFDRLDEGVPFAEVVEAFAEDPRVRGTGGLTEPFSLSERPALGAIAWDLEPGDRYGPIPERGGYLLFELVEKEQIPAAQDSAGREMARRELRRMKEQRRLTLFLSGVGATRGFRVFDDRVVQMEVSSVPMLTFRLLGFGGRMFAVPFVDRQIEWLMVDPPQDVMVP